VCTASPPVECRICGRDRDQPTYCLGSQRRPPPIRTAYSTRETRAARRGRLVRCSLRLLLGHREVFMRDLSVARLVQILELCADRLHTANTTNGTTRVSIGVVRVGKHKIHKTQRACTAAPSHTAQPLLLLPRASSQTREEEHALTYPRPPCPASAASRRRIPPRRSCRRRRGRRSS
jgi:hypothetical protein